MYRFKILLVDLRKRNNELKQRFEISFSSNFSGALVCFFNGYSDYILMPYELSYNNLSVLVPLNNLRNFIFDFGHSTRDCNIYVW